MKKKRIFPFLLLVLPFFSLFIIASAFSSSSLSSDQKMIFDVLDQTKKEEEM